MALDLASKGHDLVLHYNSNETAAKALLKEVEALGVSARLMCFNVRDRAQCDEAISTDIEKHGAYYGVVCNAGIIRDNAFPAMEAEDWDDVIRTNLDAFYHVLKPCVMPMVRAKQGGRIITMASVSGLMGNRGQTNYAASKGGLMAATKSLALELAKRKITVNCVAPGIIETEMTEEMDQQMIKNMVPLRRAGQAKEVASLVSYLMSDEAAYITRQVISVNGGLC